MSGGTFYYLPGRYVREADMVGGLRGELSSVDGYMNIALEKTVEYVGGQVRNKYGDVFIRGNNGEFGLRVKGGGGREERGEG